MRENKRSDGSIETQDREKRKEARQAYEMSVLSEIINIFEFFSYPCEKTIELLSLLKKMEDILKKKLNSKLKKSDKPQYSYINAIKVCETLGVCLQGLEICPNFNVHAELKKRALYIDFDRDLASLIPPEKRHIPFIKSGHELLRDFSLWFFKEKSYVRILIKPSTRYEYRTEVPREFQIVIDTINEKFPGLRPLQWQVWCTQMRDSVKGQRKDEILLVTAKLIPSEEDAIKWVRKLSTIEGFDGLVDRLAFDKEYRLFIKSIPLLAAKLHANLQWKKHVNHHSCRFVFFSLEDMAHLSQVNKKLRKEVIDEIEKLTPLSVRAADLKQRIFSHPTISTQLFHDFQLPIYR